MTTECDKIPLKSCRTTRISLFLFLSLFLSKIYATLILLFYLWHEIHSCCQQAYCLIYINCFHPDVRQFEQKSWKIKCKLCVFPLFALKQKNVFPDVEWSCVIEHTHQKNSKCLSRIDWVFESFSAVFILHADTIWKHRKWTLNS